MKKQHIILGFLLILSSYSSGQTLKERVTIKGGYQLWENLMKEMYLYPAFKEGTVEYKNGSLFNRMMNYNRMLGSVQFIDEKNDTLELANEDAIKQVSIGTDRFIYSPSCMQSVKPDDAVKLLKNEKTRIADIRQVGAMGKTNSGASIETPNQVYTWMNSINLNVNEALLLSKVTSFYIQSPEGEILPASKANVLKLFSAKETAVKDFIKSNDVSFRNEQSLLSLTAFLSGL